MTSKGDMTEDDIERLLAGQPRPVMPEAVWTRLSEALAAEPPFEPTAETDSSGGVVVPLRRRRAGRLAGGLVAAAAVVLLGGIVVTSGSSPEPAPVAIGGDGAAQPAALSVTTSGTSYTATTLATEAKTALARAGMDPTAPLSSASVVQTLTNSGFTASREALAGCLGAIVRAVAPDGSLNDSTALLVDRGTFEGRDAGIVVLMSNRAATPTLHVVAVAASCAPVDPGVLRHVTLAAAS